MSPGAERKPTVVFLHGIARTHLSMVLHRSAVRRAGYPTWSRSYPSLRLSIGWMTPSVRTGGTHRRGLRCRWTFS